MDYQINEFNPKEIAENDPFWDTYYSFIQISSKERDPDEPVLTKEFLIQRQRQDIFKFAVRRFIVEFEGEFIGWYAFGYYEKDHPEYEVNGHSMRANIVVLEKYQRKGIGTVLHKKIIEAGKEQGIKVLATGANTESGLNFSKKMGGKITIEGQENRLQMEEVDWDLMQKWVGEGLKRAEKVELKLVTEIPEELLDNFLEVYNESFNLQPLGESSIKTNIDREMHEANEKRDAELGTKRYIYLSIEADGVISGITEIFTEKEREHRIIQGITGVSPKYRSRGLGKWMKAQMMLFIRENIEGVEYILTGNATENAPMLSINKRMGFKEHKGGSAIEFDIEEQYQKFFA